MTRKPHRVVVPHLMPRHEAAVGILQAAGCEVVRLPEPVAGARSSWTPALIESHARIADAFMGSFNGFALTREVLAASPQLRVVTSPIIGTENIDVEAATELGIVVAFGNTPENYIGVAEAVVMLIAALRKHLPQKLEAVRSGGWRVPHAGNLVRNATIGFIGLGGIGRATARRLANWDCELIAYDPYVDVQVARDHQVTLVDLDTLLTRSDVVSVMVTLSDETRYLIGRRELALMKPGAYLINTARGGCIDEAALLEALDAGRIAGAAIDTWENEHPDARSPLRGHPRVLGTAHNVGHSEELYAGHPPAAAENTLLALRGEEPLFVRNPSVLPRWRERLARLALLG
jgi:D-3-phosphoglycerate dehydrogenase / 2-oxoglutarate reductase